MRKNLLILITISAAINLSGQDIPDLNSLLRPKYETGEFKVRNKADKDYWREKDEVVLICIDHILNSSDGFKNQNRVGMTGFVTEWFVKSQYGLPYNDKLAVELIGINMYVWFYYMLGVSKEYLEGPRDNIRIEDLQLSGLKSLQSYFGNENNFDESSDVDLSDISKNDLFIQIKKARSDKQLKKIINQFAAQTN